MEPSFLLQNKTSGKIYKHYAIHPLSNKDLIDRKIEFFYVGKGTLKIDYLIKTFQSGYAAETVQNALSILKRIAAKNKIPDIIIVDANLGEASVKELFKYTSGNNLFSPVPFILEASQLSEIHLNKYKGARYLDEIIFLDEMNNSNSSEKLIAKVEFLKKIKMQSRLYAQQGNIQLSDVLTNFKELFKRVFDIVVTIVAIIILSPVFLIIALALKLESGGPVLYVSKRAGRGFRVFNFYKFRTMVPGADEKIEQLSDFNHYHVNNEDGPVFFKMINDSRITKIGAFLRNTSLDELPQFFNVLVGDMSLVGNRPLPLYEAVKLTTDEWAERFMAPAGITGLWQIKKRGQEEMSDEERINLDIAYAHKYNFMYDLWIMANTPPALIQKSKA